MCVCLFSLLEASSFLMEIGGGVDPGRGEGRGKWIWTDSSMTWTEGDECI